MKGNPFQRGPRVDLYTELFLLGRRKVFRMQPHRLHILISREMDLDLASAAAREGTSKAGILRALIRKHLPRTGPLAEDPVEGMFGTDEFEPAPLLDGDVYR